MNLVKEETVSQSFSVDQYLKCRQDTIDIARELAHRIVHGMRESEAHEILGEILRRKGITKLWHPSKIRFHKNTLCTFKEPSISDECIQIGDLFYVDIGPVLYEHEGDYGETFCCGGGTDPLITASYEVFKETEKKLKSERLTGKALYDYAFEVAKNLGFELDNRSGGHRGGDFPHAIFHKGKLMDFYKTPKSGLWILEIHLIDRKRERAAFFEDILGLEDLISSRGD